MCLLQQFYSDDLDFKKQKSFSLSFVFATFLTAMPTILNKSNLKKEGFVLAHALRVQSIMAK